MTQSNYEVHLFKIYHNGNVPKTMNNRGIPDVFDDKFYYICSVERKSVTDLFLL